jgi:hypothetical protein
MLGVPCSNGGGGDTFSFAELGNSCTADTGDSPFWLYTLEVEADGVPTLGVSAGLRRLAGGATLTEELIDSARSSGIRKGKAALVICRDDGGAGGSIPRKGSFGEDGNGDVDGVISDPAAC